MVGANAVVTLPDAYQVAPLEAVENSTVGVPSVAESKFQWADKLVAAVLARVMPAVVPSIWSAAAIEAASTYAWVSFLTMKMCPRSIARPMAPIRATAVTAIVRSTIPLWLFRRLDI